MRPKTKFLKGQIEKYIELNKLKNDAQDSFLQTRYDMQAQDLKSELDEQLYNVHWTLFLDVLKKLLKENDIKFFISSEIGEEEREYASEIDNRYYVPVTDMNYKVSVKAPNNSYVESEFLTRAYWGPNNDDKYIGLVNLLTENGDYKAIFKAYPGLIKYAYKAFEATEILSAKKEKARLVEQLRKAEEDHRNKVLYLKGLIKDYDKIIYGIEPKPTTKTTTKNSDNQ